MVMQSAVAAGKDFKCWQVCSLLVKQPDFMIFQGDFLLWAGFPRMCRMVR